MEVPSYTTLESDHTRDYPEVDPELYIEPVSSIKSQSCSCCGCNCKINITLLVLGAVIAFIQSLNVSLQVSSSTSIIVQYIVIVLSALIVTFQSLQLGLSKLS